MATGPAARRERERQELRQAILTAAGELAHEGGWGAVTMRRVAARVEYSPPAIYEYFASKEAILAALIEDGFIQLLTRVKGVPAAESPRERILLMAEAHWEFALQNPALYRAMYGLDGMPFPGEELLAERVITATLREAVALYRGEPVVATGSPVTGLDGDVTILLATVHGLTGAALAGRIAGGAERGQRLLRRAVRTLLDQWGE